MTSKSVIVKFIIQGSAKILIDKIRISFSYNKPKKQIIKLLDASSYLGLHKVYFYFIGQEILLFKKYCYYNKFNC